MSEALLKESPEIRPATASSFASNRKRFQASPSPHLPVMVLDAEGNIQHLTPAARRMLEYRHDQPIDACFFSLVHGRNQYQVMRDVADMVCYGRAHATWLLRLRTGQGRWEWFKATVQNDLHEPEAAITIVLRDVHGG